MLTRYKAKTKASVDEALALHGGKAKARIEYRYHTQLIDQFWSLFAICSNGSH